LVSTVTSGQVRRGEYSVFTARYTNREDSMDRTSGEGVPALQNEDVTGMREDKQEEVIEESGKAPRRQAAKEFYDEQRDQAAQTKPAKDQQS
jgi:hypothetical protein